MSVRAIQFIRQMRGGSQSQLMLADDGNLWVVKFTNNPQHARTLANEWIANQIVAAMGLDVPACDVIEVGLSLVESGPELVVHRAHGVSERCSPGLQFGCRFVGGLMPGKVVDELDDCELEHVLNRDQFLGVLCADKWMGNCDVRQAVFTRVGRGRQHKALFIDNGLCFNGGNWTFPDHPLKGAYARDHVYAGVEGCEVFEPWLALIEEFDLNRLELIAKHIPVEWHGGVADAVDRLIYDLYERRFLVRSLLAEFRDSSRVPFPSWTLARNVSYPWKYSQKPQVIESPTAPLLLGCE